MATTLSALNCPNCGGKIQPPPDAKRTYCPYCGTTIAIDNGEIIVHIHNYDEAELRRIELEEEHRKQEKLEHEQREREAAEETRQLQEKYSRRKTIWRILLISSIVLILIAAFVYDSTPQPFHDGMALFCGSIVLFGWPALIIWRLVMLITRPKRK